jgi:hypothetical protein
VKQRFAIDWIDLKIDQDRMAHGEDVAARLRHGKGGGIPWSVMLNAVGEELVTSDGPGGNIGCPVTDAERTWFMEMLRKTRQRASEEDLAVIEAELGKFAAPILEGQRAARERRRQSGR